MKTATANILTTLAAGLLAALVLLAALPMIAHADTGCENEAARQQSDSTALVDCRAYEMVSPLNKNGGDIDGIDGISSGGVVQASPDGNKVTYTSLASFATENENGTITEPEGGPVGDQYLANRTNTHWNNQNITPPLTTPEVLRGEGAPYYAFNETLTQGLIYHLGENKAPLPGAPEGEYNNFNLHNLPNGTSQALLTTTPPTAPREFALSLAGATPDLAHIILTSNGALTEGAIPGNNGSLSLNVYEWTGGKMEAANILPGVTSGETAPPSGFDAVSSDGSRVVWSYSTPSGEEALFVRQGLGSPNPETIQVDAPQGGTGTGGGDFLAMSADGSRIFFKSHERLTPDASSANGGFSSGPGDLYEYDITTRHLSDLTVDTGDPNGADVKGVLGASRDGSYVYFTASGKLASTASSQTCENGAPGSGCNLYLWHNNTISFIGVLTGGDDNDWTDNTARVSPDGTHLVFMSEADLTGYNNGGPGCSGSKCQEVYSYTAGDPGAVCISCNPSGESPLGPSSIPGKTQFNAGGAFYSSRVLSGEGDRVFFDSDDGLVSADSNGTEDVYEWEPDGTGTCTSAASTFVPGEDGCVSLISGGASSESSSFVDASANGSDVFFITRQQLVPGDTDQEVDLYDAREGGGFFQLAEPACTGTGCQGVPGAQPIFATPATGTFEGADELPAAAAKPVVKPAVKKAKQCAKGKRLTHGRCVRKANAKQRGKTKHGKKATNVSRAHNTAKGRQ